MSVVYTKSSCVSVEVRCDVPELENGYYSGYRTGESILLVSTRYYSSVARQCRVVSLEVLTTPAVSAEW